MRQIWCKHYRAMSNHTTCEAGVEYENFKGVPFDSRPCFFDGPSRAACDSAEYPTAEEIAAQDAEDERRFKMIGRARKAIVDHLGGPWKRGTPGGQGVIDCPVCGAEKSLRFSRAGYNGHIHAACRTEGCVSWME